MRSASSSSAISDSNKGHFLFIGDQAFFYDLNILWSGLLPDNLSVFLFNNGGGGIFELIKGPAAQPEFEELFYLKQKRNAEGISKELGIEYESCCYAIRAMAGKRFRALGVQGRPEFSRIAYLQLLLKGLGSASSGQTANAISSQLPHFQDRFR